MSDGTKHFTPEAIAAFQAVIAVCIRECVHSPDSTEPLSDRLLERMAAQFQAFVPEKHHLHHLTNEDLHDLSRAWMAFQKTMQSKTLRIFDPHVGSVQ